MVVLARQLGLPAETIQMVMQRGCETPADWKYAVLEAPEDKHEKILWKAVQQAPALDKGSMVALALQVRKRPVAMRKGCVTCKVGTKVYRSRAFKGAKGNVQRKAVDNEKRRQAAQTLVELSWGWAPAAGLAKGCTDLSSVAAQRRFQRCCERLTQGFEAKSMLEACKAWKELTQWCQEEGIEADAWPLDPMFIEDFLDQFRAKGRSVPRAKFNALVFLQRHASAPLSVTGVHVPTPAAQKKATRGQAVPLQPLMVRSLRKAFQQDLAEGSWRRVATAVGVVAVVKPLRYAHVNRSRPVERTEHWMTFWAFKGKARSETGEREGFRWSVAMAEPILRDACTVLWNEWHALAEQWVRGGQPVPEFLCFDALTKAELTLSQFNQVIEDVTKGALSTENKVPITSYSLRRVPPGLLQMRAATWEHRLALGGWRAGALQAANLMPLRYSAEKFNEELKVCAAQAHMTAEWADASASWAESRVWWAEQPRGTVSTWEKTFQKNILEALALGLHPELAAGMEELVKDIGDAKLREPEFLLTDKPADPKQIDHFTVPKKKRTREQSQVADGWICAERPNGVMHRCGEGKPLCHKKKSRDKAVFLGKPKVFDTYDAALAMVILDNRDWCSACAADCR